MGVMTPLRCDGQGADLTCVEASTDGIRACAKRGSAIAGELTVPVGTAGDCLRAGSAVGAAAEPLRESFAIKDSVDQYRLVMPSWRALGTRAWPCWAAVYAPILDRSTLRLETDQATAELVKVAANSFLARKISFMTARPEVADIAGADVTTARTCDRARREGLPETPQRRCRARRLRLPKGLGGTASAEESRRGESVAFWSMLTRLICHAVRHVVVRIADSSYGDYPFVRLQCSGWHPNPKATRLVSPQRWMSRCG